MLSVTSMAAAIINAIKTAGLLISFLLTYRLCCFPYAAIHILYRITSFGNSSIKKDIHTDILLNLWGIQTFWWDNGLVGWFGGIAFFLIGLVGWSGGQQFQTEFKKRQVDVCLNIFLSLFLSSLILFLVNF